MLPTCENCGKENPFAVMDPQAAYCCQDCIEDRANVSLDPEHNEYRKMAYCSCGKKGVPNTGSYYDCGYYLCSPDDPLSGFLTFGPNHN